MGGAAAFELAVLESTFIRERLKGIILVSPAIDGCIKISQSQTLILKALAKLLPNYNTSLIVTHGPDWCESEYAAQDPYYEEGLNLNTRKIPEFIVINLISSGRVCGNREVPGDDESRVICALPYCSR